MKERYVRLQDIKAWVSFVMFPLPSTQGGGGRVVRQFSHRAAGDMYIVTVPISSFFNISEKKVGFTSHFCDRFTSVKLFTKKNCMIFSQSTQLLFTQKLISQYVKILVFVKNTKGQNTTNPTKTSIFPSYIFEGYKHSFTK